MQVISNAVRIVECVIQHQPLGVTEVANMLNLPKTSVHRTLRSLEEAGWLARKRQAPRMWVQTPRLWVLVHQGPGNEVRDLTLPVQEMLNRLTDENVHLTQSEDGCIVVINKIESTQPIRVYDPLGTKVPLHQSSSGKAMLSTWTSDDVIEYIERTKEKSARATDIPDLDGQALRKELEEVREKGYAMNRGSWRSEISGIGAPLSLDGLDKPAPYGLAISIPTHRFTADKIPQFAEFLLQARQQVLEASALG